MIVHQNSIFKKKNLQNRAVLIIYKLGPRESTKEYHEKMKIQHLEDRRSLHILKLLDWLVTQPGYLDVRVLNMRSHGDGRRPIKLMCPKKELYKQSFLYKGGRLWNILPTYAHNCRKPEELKNCLRELMQAGRIGYDNRS